MTLARTLQQKLADWKPDAGRQVLTCQDETSGWSAVAHVDRSDDLSAVLWELGLRRTKTAPAGWTLQSWAQSLPAKVTGLLEPLAVYEIDAARHEALLRSHEPQVKGEQRTYYEILLRGDSHVMVRRFQGSTQPGSHRQQVAFTLTLEGLAKLVSDLTA